MALAANALTTLATMRDELGITDDSQNDRLTRMINVASAAAESYTNRTFQRGTRTQKIRPPNGPRIFLDATPLASITSITDDGATVDSSEYEIEDASAGIVFRSSGWGGRDLTVPRSIVGDVMTGTGKSWLSITYIGGYVLPNDAGDRDLPYDIEQACILTVTSLFRGRGRDRAVASKATGDASFSFRLPNEIIGVGAGGVIPDEAVVLLRPYLRVVD